MPRAKQICSTSACRQTVKGRGKCKDHQPIGWYTHDRRSRLPKDWERRRLIVLRRDNYTCYVCGADGTEVDHVNPGDDHDLANLAAICRECHKAKTLRER
ncbi:HNH endonuclease [Streptosporangium sp. OZ121]|uniref:HNH endonuclease n=1 Tax=Streptosporangium sp. OZ121 TaxID=3444183 RepID=UPI003F7A32CD